MVEIDFHAHRRAKDEAARVAGIRSGIAEELGKEKPDYVRLNALRRNLRGAEDVAPLTNVVDEKRVAHLKHVDAVSEIGKANKQKLIDERNRERAEELRRKAIAAAKEAADADNDGNVTEDEKRAFIEEKTGKKPHWNLGSDKLQSLYEKAMSAE